MTALGYEAKDIYVYAPSKTVKNPSWYIYHNDRKYVSNLRKKFKSNKSNVMFTSIGYAASNLTKGMEYLDDMHVLSTCIQPTIDNTAVTPVTTMPDWTFSYPYKYIYDTIIDGVVTSPYTMDYIYN